LSEPENEVVVEKKKRGRPKNPFKVPDPSEESRKMMASSLIYRLLVKGFLLKPEDMDAVPISFILAEASRGSEQTNEPGSLKILVPDGVVKNIRGDERLRDLLVLVRIPRDVHDELVKNDPLTDLDEEETENEAQEG